MHWWRGFDLLALQSLSKLALLWILMDILIIYCWSHSNNFHFLILINAVKFYARRWRFADPTTNIRVINYFLRLLLHQAFDSTTLVRVGLLPHHFHFKYHSDSAQGANITPHLRLWQQHHLKSTNLWDLATIISSFKTIDTSEQMPSRQFILMVLFLLEVPACQCLMRSRTAL